MLSLNAFLWACLILLALIFAVVAFTRWKGFENILVFTLPLHRFSLELSFALKPYLMFSIPLFILTVSRLVSRRRSVSSAISFAPYKVFLPWAGTALFMLLSAIQSVDQIESVRHWILLMWGFAIIFLFEQHLRTIHDVQRTIDTYLLLGWLLGISGVTFSVVYYWLGNQGLASGRYGGGVFYQSIGDPMGRLRSVSWDPNHYVFDLLPIVFLAIARGLRTGSRGRRKRHYVVLSSVLVLNLLLTFSRGGLFALFVGVGALLALCIRHGEGVRQIGKSSMTILVALLIVCVPLYVIWGTEVVQRMVYGFTFRSRFGESRLGFWRGSWLLWLEHPVWGIGQGTVPRYLPKQVHNAWLELLAENGIIVFALHLWLVVAIVVRAVKLWTNACERSGSVAFDILGLLVGLIAMIAMLGSMSLFTVISYWFQLRLLALACKLWVPDGVCCPNVGTRTRLESLAC